MTSQKLVLNACLGVLLSSSCLFGAAPVWSHVPDLSTPVAREIREQQHRDLIQSNEKFRAMRKEEKANPLPSGVEVVPLELVQKLLQEEAKVTRTSSQSKIAATAAISYNKNACLTKTFTQVSWLFCVTDTSKKSLWLGPVFIKRYPSDSWHKVIALAGMAELFVPYENANFRPYDLQWITQLNAVGNAEAGSNGSVLTLSGETVPTVVVENRDGGVGLLCHQNPNLVERSQEFVVWGVADGGNYDNIIEYGFRNDGVLTFRMGNTGYGDPANQRGIHTHNALWRVDIDVNGSGGDTAFLDRHFESQGTAADLQAAVSYESGHELSGKEFSTLLVTDSSVNSQGNNLGYRFVPSYTGTSRHYEPNDLWTQRDIYLSKYRPSELGWMADAGNSVQTIFELINGTGWTDPDHYLLTQISSPEYIANSDLVAWVKTSFHHSPSDEENPVVPVPNAAGVTSTHWSGFELMPNNFFNANPLSPNATCNHP